MRKLSNTEAELKKKTLLIKKACIRISFQRLTLDTKMKVQNVVSNVFNVRTAKSRKLFSQKTYLIDDCQGPKYNSAKLLTLTTFQPTFTCSKSTMEKQEQCAKSTQS